MSATAWLPADAAPPPALESALEAVFADWSRKWFVHANLKPLGPIARGGDGAALRDLDWQLLDDSIGLALSSESRAALGALVLGLAFAHERPEPEVALIAKVTDECLADLKRRLAAFAKLPVDRDWQAGSVCGPYCLKVGRTERLPALTLGFSTELFVHLVRTSLPTPVLEPLGNGVPALARLETSLGTLLGRCRLTLAELEGLAPGDVLVLDHAPADPLPLLLDGVPAPKGRCTLTEAEDGFVLKILEPLA